MYKTADIQLDMTCGACPEQYDAYAVVDGVRKKVGYFRLRHGSFTVSHPEIWTNFLTAYPEGDGEFMDDERDHYLDMGKFAVCMELNKALKDFEYSPDYDGWRQAVVSGDTLLSYPDWVAQATQIMTAQGEPGPSEEQESEEGNEEGSQAA